MKATDAVELHAAPACLYRLTVADFDVLCHNLGARRREVQDPPRPWQTSARRSSVAGSDGKMVSVSHV